MNKNVIYAAIFGAAAMTTLGWTSGKPTIETAKIIRDTVYIEVPIQPSVSLEVTATCYHPVKAQCNSRYWETATQAIIDTLHPEKHRWIAISRDLLNKGFDMGDTVVVEGTWIYDGKWIIQDKMNKRWSNKIDFLVKEGMRLGKWKGVKISKI